MGEVYRATTAADFIARMEAFREWGGRFASWPALVREAMAKLWNRTSEYARAYEDPLGHDQHDEDSHCHRAIGLLRLHADFATRARILRTRSVIAVTINTRNSGSMLKR